MKDIAIARSRNVQMKRLDAVLPQLIRNIDHQRIFLKWIRKISAKSHAVLVRLLDAAEEATKI
jgi:hypothetical protein